MLSGAEFAMASVSLYFQTLRISPPYHSTVHLDEGCAVLTGLGVNSVAPTESQLTHGCSCITQLAATHVLREELKCVKHLLFCNAELLLQSWIALIKAPF